MEKRDLKYLVISFGFIIFVNSILPIIDGLTNMAISAINRKVNKLALDMELDKSGHTSIENSDKEGIISYLERAMENYQSLLDFDYNYWQEFEPQKVVMKYKNFIINNLSIKR